MATIHLEVITPERVVFSDDVDFIVVPGFEGELTILPDHIPLFTKLKTGEMRIKKGSQEIYLAVTGGFLEVELSSKVNILADYAIRSEEVEVVKAEEAKKRAEEAMREKKTEVDLVVAEAELRKALLELKVSRRHKSPKIPSTETS